MELIAEVQSTATLKRKKYTRKKSLLPFVDENIGLLGKHLLLGQFRDLFVVGIVPLG